MPESTRDARLRAPQSAASPPAHSPRRRHFLFALGATGAGAAAVAAAPGVGAVAAADTPPAEASRGYRVTEHVRDYYDSTRL